MRQSAGRISRWSYPLITGQGLVVSGGKSRPHEPILEGPEVTGISISCAGPNDRKGSRGGDRDRYQASEFTCVVQNQTDSTLRRRSARGGFLPLALMSNGGVAPIAVYF